LKLRRFITILILTMTILGWAACAVEQNSKILQFDPLLVLGAGTSSEKDPDKLVSLINPEIQNPYQTSGDTLQMDQIGQDLKAILQIPADTSEIPLKAINSDKDIWILQLESSFNEILEQQVSSEELEEFSYDLSMSQVITNNINSNIMNLMNNGGSWDTSWSTDQDSKELMRSPNKDNAIANNYLGGYLNAK
jgi:hypothetical protein